MHSGGVLPDLISDWLHYQQVSQISVMAEIPRDAGHFKEMGQFEAKFQVEGYV